MKKLPPPLLKAIFLDTLTKKIKQLGGEEDISTKFFHTNDWLQRGKKAVPVTRTPLCSF